MTARRLIINADDLGYSRGINDAVARCARQGVLSSATLMACGGAFEHAVEMLRDLPHLGIGVHLTLTELPPVLPSCCLPGLAGVSGRLPDTFRGLWLGMATRRGVRDLLLREMSAQMEKVLCAGIWPTHVDTHKHLHVFPVLLDAVLEVARRYGVGWIRNPFDDAPVGEIARAVQYQDRRTYWLQAVAARAVRVFRRHFRHRVARAGLRTPDRFYGVGLTGVWSRNALAVLLPHLPVGVSEIMFHPGDCDAGLRDGRTRLLRQREWERDLLMSDTFRDLISSHGLHVVRFGEVFS